ncbi:PHD finger protein 3 [Linnemannia zychae]|nr:PHD finger protein 3 [Linnemannia zychae]
MTETTQHPDEDYLHLDLTEPDEDGTQEDGLQVLDGTPMSQAQTETGTLDEAIASTTQIQTLPNSDIEMEPGAMTPGGTVVLLSDSLNSHSDEHVFLDFVHDPLSHTTQDSITPGVATGVDSHDSHTDSGLSIALDPQHTSLEDIDIQRPFDVSTLNCVSPDLIFQPNGIYVDAQSDSDAGAGSSTSSGKATKPVHPSILRPLTPEEVMVPIAVRRSNRARQPSNLAVQSSEYLMQSQGLHGSANSTPTTPGPSGVAPVERMTRSKKVYCYCQKPDDGNVMIQCDNCRQWFHGACVDITEEVAEMMELKNEKFFCEPCDERMQEWKTTGSAGVGNAFKVPSDSRDCDLPTCLNEARATSDYCSEECAIKGIELQATEAVMNKENIPPVVYIPTPKRASTSNASSSTQPESPKVEQDPVRLTALKGLTECLLVGFEVKPADGGVSQGENSEQPSKELHTKLEVGAEGTVTGKTETVVDTEQASRLAVAIEKELYSSTASPGYAACGRDYKAKYRSLLFNLKDKNNVILRARLVSGELEPYDLVRLSHEELANPELQNIKKEMRKKSIHDSVLTVEEEPYIKKTHKGELSFVPRLSSVGGPSTVPSLDHARSDDSSSVSSGSGDDEHHHKSSNNSRTEENHRSNNSNLSSDTQNNGDNMNNNSHMDSMMDYEEPQDVKVGDKGTHEPSTSSSTGSSEDVLDKLLARIQTNKRSSEGTTVDILAGDKRQRRMGTTDIGDNVAESQEDTYLPREPSPYSPSPPGSPTIQSTTPPDSPPPHLLEELQRAAEANRRNTSAHRGRPTIWQGSLSMHQVAKFSAKAVQVGGRELSTSQGGSRRPAWSDVLSKDISVDGRIGIAAVEAYVGQQAQSATKEIVVIKFDVQDPSPSLSDPHRVEQDKLFDYFHSKQRNGVIPQRNRHVKDMYLVPLAVKDPLPEYLRKVIHDDASVRGTVPKNCLLGVLVLNKDPSHSGSSHHQSRREQPQPSSSSHSKSAPSSNRRRPPSPDTSRPYPETHPAHNRNKRPIAPPLGPSSPSDSHRSGEFAQSLKSPTYSSGPPSTTIGAPLTVPLASPSQLSPGAHSHRPLVPASTLHSAPSAAPTAPKKVPTLQELQGLVNQLFPSARPAPSAPSAPTLGARAPVVDPRPTSTPGPTAAAAAAAAAVSAQLNGSNLSSLMASLPASLSHLRPTPPQQRSDQFQPPPSVPQGNPYGIPPAHPVFSAGMPVPGPPLPPPNLFPLPPYLMGQYGMPMAPPTHSAPPTLPPSMPPVPPNPQQYYPHFFPGQEHLPPSAPPTSHPSFAAPPRTMNSRGNGPHDPRWSSQ